jgi:hypothetical protein
MVFLRSSMATYGAAGRQEIKGFEVMRMIRRGQCLTCKPHVSDEVRFVNKLFDVFEIAA